MNWQDLQTNAAQVLHGGLNHLISQEAKQQLHTLPKTTGNYLLLNGNQPLYIGQALNLHQRLTTHTRSSRFKDYKESLAFRHIETAIGRKEIEEFGMFKLQTPLNKSHRNRLFQVGSLHPQVAYDLWQDSQKQQVQLLEQAISAIDNHPDFGTTNSSTLQPGVYLVSYQGQLIYIGESISLTKRILAHHTTTRFSVFRRSLAQAHFGFQLKTKAELGITTSKDKKRSFLALDEERVINDFIAECQFTQFPVNIGRFELEEALIRHYQPTLNKKMAKI